LGSAPASGAVFRALAENKRRGFSIRRPLNAGGEAPPAAPEAGALPNPTPDKFNRQKNEMRPAPEGRTYFQWIFF